jgi:hypothetical protein
VRSAEPSRSGHPAVHMVGKHALTNTSLVSQPVSPAQQAQERQAWWMSHSRSTSVQQHARNCTCLILTHMMLPIEQQHCRPSAQASSRVAALAQHPVLAKLAAASHNPTASSSAMHASSGPIAAIALLNATLQQHCGVMRHATVYYTTACNNIRTTG